MAYTVPNPMGTDLKVRGYISHKAHDSHAICTSQGGPGRMHIAW